MPERRGSQPLRALQAALAFLTILPMPTAALTEEDFARAAPFFAWVGLLLGGLLVGADQLLRAFLPTSIAALLLLLLWIGLTGALHWDGLLDSLDALLAPYPPARRLAILKEVSVGSFALVGGVLALLLFFHLLQELPSTQRGGALLLAPTTGRWLIGHAQRQWPYLRAEGLGTLLRPPRLTLGESLPLGIALLAGTRGVVAVAVTVLLTHGVASWMARRLGGGLTGDCYGALCEVGQLLILFAFIF